MNKYTKIVATISNHRCEVDFVRELFEAGMSVVRMNTAHLDFEGLDKIVDNVRQVSDDIAFLVDTKGPEIRTTASDADVILKANQKIILAGNSTEKTTSEIINVSYNNIVEDVNINSEILIDDGELALLVESKDDKNLYCK